MRHIDAAKTPGHGSPEKELPNYSKPDHNPNFQEMWDAELLNAWKLDKKIGYAAGRFYYRVTGEDQSNASLDKISELLDRHEIKHCGFRMEEREEGKVIPFGYRFGMAAVVYIRLASPKLHKVLIGGKYRAHELVPYMDRFTFKSIKPFDKTKRERHNKQQNVRNSYKSTRQISKRSIDKTHDWGTVK